MTHRHNIYTYISRLFLSVSLLLIATTGSFAQGKLLKIEKDSIPFFKGFAISTDLVGPAMMALSDYGEVEGALRINLHDQYFPIFELGYGRANHSEDIVTGISYKTSAPYFRIGCDLNLLKNKHGLNRIYGGIRYAFTSYKVDITHATYEDPVWGWSAPVNINGAKCNQHWAEVVFGVDAYIIGPLHLGWTVRYKRRIAHQEGDVGNTWYVPGYGKAGDTRLGANFNIILDI